MNKRQAKKALKKSGTLLSEELPMISLTKEEHECLSKSYRNYANTHRKSKHYRKKWKKNKSLVAYHFFNKYL